MDINFSFSPSNQYNLHLVCTAIPSNCGVKGEKNSEGFFLYTHSVFGSSAKILYVHAEIAEGIRATNLFLNCLDADAIKFLKLFEFLKCFHPSFYFSFL